MGLVLFFVSESNNYWLLSQPLQLIVNPQHLLRSNYVLLIKLIATFITDGNNSLIVVILVYPF